MGNERPQWWWRVSPPLATLVALGVLFGAVYLLNVAAYTGARGSKIFVESQPWLVWRIAAGIAFILFVALGLFAGQILRSGPEWGLTGSAPRRWRYLGAAAVAVAVFGGFLLVLPGRGPDMPIRGLQWRTQAVLLAGLLAAIPWVAIVWSAATECNGLQETVDQLPEQGLPVPAQASDPPGPDSVLCRSLIVHLLRLWTLLVTSVTAFALAVVAAIVTTGALRAAFVAAHPARAADFPPANVLLYGAFFAVVLSVITIPLAVAWRVRARHVVERAYPLPADGQPTEEWSSTRARLEHLLHLDVPLLRNPLTALSIFTPLVTAALAAFIPQLAQR